MPAPDPVGNGSRSAVENTTKHAICAPAHRHRTREKMERVVFVYTTYPSVVEAEKAGRALLERKLAACVNILPGMVSLYRWQGALERGEDAGLARRSGLRGCEGDARLFHARDPGDPHRERRSDLLGLDPGGDGKREAL